VVVGGGGLWAVGGRSLSQAVMPAVACRGLWLVLWCCGVVVCWSAWCAMVSVGVVACLGLL
jgi:hypothetical protein